MAMIIGEVTENRGRPLAYHSDTAATDAERQARARVKGHVLRLERIAVLDMETDPFEDTGQERIEPFCACLYSDQFDPIVIWNEDFDAFVDEVIEAIEALDGYTIYAHNGGKFDFLFLLHKMRGQVLFKGRGIMSAKIGSNELRDSFHIIPEKLAGYHKEVFDYTWMRKKLRNKHKDAIISYLVSDCQYLFEIVKGFLNRFGFKISIGQAAMSEMRKVYKVDRISKMVDKTLRQFFFGGRVECLRGAGHFIGDYKLYDVNSMYPDAMANELHPSGSNYTRVVGKGIVPNTCFVELSCYSAGALVRKNENNETSAPFEYGRFFTTIHEYNAATELGLLSRVQIHAVITCDKFTKFDKFIIPLYEEKAALKDLLDGYKKLGDESSNDYWHCKQQYTFSKLIQNNAYGKFAQNPERYKEHCLTGPDDPAPEGFESPFPEFVGDHYAIWSRPSPRSAYNNVGTAASITGAARAKLLRAITGATDAIYCDTDSLICKEISGVDLHPSRLGAWDLEAEFSEVIIAGKKLYACRPKGFTVGQEKKIKVRSKGASRMTWEDMANLLDGQIIAKRNPGVTITKTGAQFYMTRNIKRTAPLNRDFERQQKQRAKA